MLSLDHLRHCDEALDTQLKLALASPLWKSLPYGVELNPRLWRIELLDLKPGRRLNAKITIPWRPSAAPGGEPLIFLIKLWHNQHKACLHRRLTELNQIILDTERQDLKVPQPLFYDALAHALIYPYFPGQESAGRLPLSLNSAWLKHMFRALRGPSHA